MHGLACAKWCRFCSVNYAIVKHLLRTGQSIPCLRLEYLRANLNSGHLTLVSCASLLDVLSQTPWTIGDMSDSFSGIAGAFSGGLTGRPNQPAVRCNLRSAYLPSKLWVPCFVYANFLLFVGFATRAGSR